MKIKLKLTLIGILTFLLGVNITKAQLAGTYSVPATFSSIAIAINSLNIAGVSSTVTILISPGYTEAVPNGGYTLTATGTATSPIIFQKNGAGANPALFAYTGGTSTPGSSFQDGVFRIVGGDYITIDGIDISDPNTSNPATMEFGYGFFRASVTNGCQNNTIKNCVINLNRDNNAIGVYPANHGSRGIDMVNATIDAHTTPLIITAATGANSNNTFHRNYIQNCNIGISLSGFAEVSPYTNTDSNNDVGGTLASTGNTIVNYGGGTVAVNPAIAISAGSQYSLNISNNLINSNNGTGINHPAELRGFYIYAAPAAAASINNNTLTLKGGGTTSQLHVINNLSGSTGTNNTISISNNLITNCTYTTATSGAFYGIWNSASASTLAINNNTFSNNSTNAISGSHYKIYNSGAVSSAISISNNLIDVGTFSAQTSASNFNIYNGSGSLTTTLTISSNTFQNAVYTGTSSSTIYFIYNPSSQNNTSITNNVYNNLSINSTGSTYLCYNNNAANNLISGNSIVGTFAKNFVGGSFYGIYCYGGSTGTSSVTLNNLSNITLAGMFMYGIYHSASSTQTAVITSNTISNISNLNTASTTYGLLSGYYGNISNNLVNNISSGGPIYGLYLSTNNQTTSVFSNTISALSTTNTSIYGTYFTSAVNTSFFKNKIYDIRSTSVNALNVHGMYFTAGTLYNIHDNLVGDIKAPFANSALNPVSGMYINGGTTYNLSYNTVYLNAVTSGTIFGSSAIYASTTPALNLRNNIFINNSVPMGAGFVSAYRRSSTTLTTYSTTSNRNIFYAGTPSANNLIFYDGTNANQTLATFQTLVGPTRDAASQTENSPFISITGTNPNFLHIMPTSPSFAESGAINITGITDDFDTDIRQGNIGYVGSGTAPDIGADEFNQVLVACNLVVPAAITPTSILMCDASFTNLNGSNYTTGSGIVYQWQISPTPGGPYTDVVGGNGANYPLLYTTATLSPASYYYVLRTTCTISAQTAISNEATVTVLSYPSVSVTPTATSICMPGSPSVALTASGALTYSWIPATALNTTVGANVNSLPGSTIVYTVTGANAAGCTSITTTTITVLEAPTIVSIIASPTIVCSGGNSSLQVTSALTNSYAITNIAYAPIPTPSVGVTTLCNAGTIVTPLSSGSLDDGGWSNLQIPFNFNFFGSTYNSFAISTNGFMVMGSGNPNTFTGYGNIFPSSFAGRPSIGALYGDLNWSTLGTVQTFTTGISPNRKLIVNWNGGQFWVANGTITAQAVIHESSNTIDVHTTLCSGHNVAVEGIQNSSGTNAYVVPGRNAVTYTVVSGDAYRWSPNEGPINYTWTPSTYLTATNIPNPVANSVTAGITYSAIATSTNGCSNTATLQLLADITPTVLITGTNAICSTNTINLTASGANTYSWSTGALTSTIAETPTTTITYSVIGTSTFGCIGMASKTITVNTTPTVNVTGPSTVCAGTMITLIGNGANSYSWSTGSTLSVIAPSPTTSATYTVVGTSTAGCASTITAKSVTVFALPSVTITAPTKICVGEPVSIIASGTGVDTYSWNTGSTSAILVQSPTVTTTYTIFVANNNTGCANSKTVSITVDACVGINELSGGIEGLSVYPNPNAGIFTIALSNGKNKSIEITDVTGRIILSYSNDADKINVDIYNLANGIYYVKTSSDNKVQVSKIVKQ